MKKKKKLIVSLVALAFSIMIMLTGVYAASSPNITISGTVDFTTSASQVRVTGTIIDGYDADNQPISYVTGHTYHYYDYTDSEKITLADWVINGGENVYFKEDTNGVTDIKLKFDFVNNSPFYTVATFENVSASNNIEVDFEESVVMDVRGQTEASKSTTITYHVINDNTPASTNINFTVRFDKYLPTDASLEGLRQNLNSYTPLTTEQIEQYQNQYEQQRSLTLNRSVLTEDTQNNQNEVQNNQNEQNAVQNETNTHDANIQNETNANLQNEINEKSLLAQDETGNKATQNKINEQNSNLQNQPNEENLNTQNSDETQNSTGENIIQQNNVRSGNAGVSIQNTNVESDINLQNNTKIENESVSKSSLEKPSNTTPINNSIANNYQSLGGQTNLNMTINGQVPTTNNNNRKEDVLDNLKSAIKKHSSQNSNNQNSNSQSLNKKQTNEQDRINHIIHNQNDNSQSQTGQDKNNKRQHLLSRFQPKQNMQNDNNNQKMKNNQNPSNNINNYNIYNNTYKIDESKDDSQNVNKPLTKEQTFVSYNN